MVFSPRMGSPGNAEWRMVYRYMNQDMFQDALARGLVPQLNKIWITPHFFRFADEAKAFLALPRTNDAQSCIYFDLDEEIGKLPWRPSPATEFAPGGGLEYDYPTGNPIPRQRLVESFELEPGSTIQGVGNPPRWAFAFTEI